MCGVAVCSDLVFRAVAAAEMARPLRRMIESTDLESQGVGRTNSDARRTVVAFLSESVAQGVEVELADCIAFRAVVTALDDAVDSHQAVAAE